MTRALLDTLTEHTYSRSDFAYRLNLIREFLEFVFFTKRDVRASREVVGAFASHSNNPTADIAYLQSLPSSFLETFTQESFYATLDQLAEECTQLQTLSLTLPVVLARTLFRRFKNIFKTSPAWLMVTLIYGIAIFALGGFVTTGVERIVGYGWSAFLIALPFLAGRFFSFNKDSLIKLSILQVFTVWFPFILREIAGWGGGLSWSVATIAVVFTTYFYAAKELKLLRPQMPACEGEGVGISREGGARPSRTS